MPKFRVRFYKQVTTTDCMSIDVEADSPEAARERVDAGMKGEIDLTDTEMLTERLDREEGVHASEFTGLEDASDPNAVVELA